MVLSESARLMPLFLLLPFAGSILTFAIFTAIGYYGVKVIHNFYYSKKLQTTVEESYENDIVLQPTEKYAPIPIKDKTSLTREEQSAWEQIVNQSK